MDRRTTKTALKARVDYTVISLGMREFLDTTLSVLSGGQRKKVALAVQLLNDPPILFCDEVTTGLDSYSATHIVNTLKRIARTGKIVICTIHQPASGVFDKFDEIVLLSNGRLAYQGPVPMINQLFQKFGSAYNCIITIGTTIEYIYIYVTVKARSPSNLVFTRQYYFLQTLFIKIDFD